MTSVLDTLAETAWTAIEFHLFGCERCTEACLTGDVHPDVLCDRGFRLFVTWAATKHQAILERKAALN